ncbi:hypothetical protein P7K49_032463 [Saguinus oedipus]|uniref:Uncharacterized protein n=1 Tax=Saguinus oedipus TaxID=9490 RepID=A0ABQ9U075_SAGOE|nr:hypothetical protein P7K49_032463 [Saguinus oedipus]
MLLTFRSSYLQTSSLLASDRHLTEEERRHFCREILDFASQPSDSPVYETIDHVRSSKHEGQSFNHNQRIDKVLISSPQ